LLNLALVRKVRLFALVFLLIILIIGFSFFLIGYLKPKVAGIYIETNPPSSVFIEAVQVGRTPYRETRNPGEITLKLVPESFEKPLAFYETKVNLITGIETVVKRDFGELDETSSGEMISFEKEGKDEASLIVLSIPDSAQLSLDGSQRYITPHKITDILPGEHTLVLSTSGYFERYVKVKTHAGYKLTALVQLAKKEEEKEEEPAELPEEKGKKEGPKVEILSTSTGFLRVRKEPSTLGEEIAKVMPGEIYDLLAIDERTGWFKIAYEQGKEGWISNQYARKVEEEEAKDKISTPSATPTSKLKISVTPTPTPKPTTTP